MGTGKLNASGHQMLNVLNLWVPKKDMILLWTYRTVSNQKQQANDRNHDGSVEDVHRMIILQNDWPAYKILETKISPVKYSTVKIVNVSIFVPKIIFSWTVDENKEYVISAMSL